VKKLAILVLGTGVVLIVLLSVCRAETKAEPFGMNNVVEIARKLAQQPFQEPQKVPEFLRKLNYDHWRDIRFHPDKALWRKEKLPFQVQFFHPGFLYDRTVSISVLDHNRIEPVPFSPDLFSYGLNDFKGTIPPRLGFAGFRLHYRINSPDHFDEVAIFLGASYFRVVGKGERFGLSARALAIDTADPSGEEFPFFKEFWLQRPGPDANRMVVYALIDSPSATGAYRFEVRPGGATEVGVTCTVFLRKKVKKLGLAPLTSMFFYGENTNKRPIDDFRQEVHDSDGLSILTGGNERIWRPLENPPALLDTSFQLNNPKGFGLLERDRNFDHYQDLEVDFQLRPSAWIVPNGNWGEGVVELVQIPSQKEADDNIVSFWVPAAVPEVLRPLTLSYTMSWFSRAKAPLAEVVSTRTSRGRQDHSRRFLVDFVGRKLNSLGKDAKLSAGVSVGGGKIIEQHLIKNPFTGGWRLEVEVLPDETGILGKVLPDKLKKPLELRALLRKDNEILTETWSYVVYP